jgi:hypothetical protein
MAAIAPTAGTQARAWADRHFWIVVIRSPSSGTRSRCECGPRPFDVVRNICAVKH